MGIQQLCNSRCHKPLSDYSSCLGLLCSLSDCSSCLGLLWSLSLIIAAVLASSGASSDCGGLLVDFSLGTRKLKRSHHFQQREHRGRGGETRGEKEAEHLLDCPDVYFLFQLSRLSSCLLCLDIQIAQVSGLSRFRDVLTCSKCLDCLDDYIVQIFCMANLSTCRYDSKEVQIIQVSRLS